MVRVVCVVLCGSWRNIVLSKIDVGRRRGVWSAENLWITRVYWNEAERPKQADKQAGKQVDQQASNTSVT